MKEPHIEGVAIQGDPESCVVDREVWGEAFTGACTGAALMHHITPELLRSSFLMLKREAAVGVDGVTLDHYRANLDGNIRDLHGNSRSRFPSHDPHVASRTGLAV